jgi:hypothetical protein
MNKARDFINEVVKLEIAPLLKANGFKKKGFNFARRVGSVTHFVNVQLSSWNSGAAGSFYLNVGIAFDELSLYFGKQPPEFPQYDDCQFLVRIDQLNSALPKQFEVNESTDLHALASNVARSLGETFVTPLASVSSLQSFGNTGWVNVVPWGFPALFHYLTGNQAEARRLVQLEADCFADRGLTFASIAERLRFSFT